MPYKCKDYSNYQHKSVHPSSILSHTMQDIHTDKLSDIECHADEWELPSPESTVTSHPSCSYADHRFECRSPSPLIHPVDEKVYAVNHCLLPCCCCRNRPSLGNTEERPSIPIPIRVRRHRRVSNDVMRRLTSCEFRLGPDDTVQVETENAGKLMMFYYLVTFFFLICFFASYFVC
jgi:hypothetical protein